jgi:hypothetical protein
MPGMRLVRDHGHRLLPGSRMLVLLAVEFVLAAVVLTGAVLGPGIWGQSPADRPPPAATFVPAPAEPTGPAGPAAPTAPTTPRQLTVLGAGDILIHPPVWEQARADAGGDGFDFRPIFEALAGTVSAADLAICHLETPLAPPDGPFLGWPRFSAPPHLLETLVAVGYDTCSTASNHTLDQGEQGVYRTIDALVDAGLGWAGSARGAGEAATPTVLEVVTGDGRIVRVGHLSYTFGFNGLRRPAGKEWIANRIDLDQILAEARAAREAGAEVVVLSLHWGEEYQVEPSPSQVALAEELSAAGAVDLVLGHHAHVVQPAERVGDTWVVFGMGNQLARHAEPIDAQREGVMVRVTLTEGGDGWAVTGIEAVPTWVELSPRIRLVDLPAALDRDDLTAQQRTTYRDAYARITDSLGRRGAGADGLVVR